MKIREFAMNRSRAKRAGTLSFVFFLFSFLCVLVVTPFLLEKLYLARKYTPPPLTLWCFNYNSPILSKQTKQSQRSRRWIHEEHDVRRARISRRCSRFSRHVVPSRVQRWRRSGRGVRLRSGVRLVEHNRGETCVHRKGESYWAEN